MPNGNDHGLNCTTNNLAIDSEAFCTSTGTGLQHTNEGMSRSELFLCLHWPCRHIFRSVPT
eukprot:1348482-Amphidinium_carterae.1